MVSEKVQTSKGEYKRISATATIKVQKEVIPMQSGNLNN